MLPHSESIDFWNMSGFKENFGKTINVSNVLQSTNYYERQIMLETITYNINSNIF